MHPLAGQSQFDFLHQAKADKAPIVVLDIPLLFETGGDGFVDCVVVVSAPFAMQKQRVLARDGMSEARFNDILAKQTPDEEKRQRADFIVDSSDFHCRRAHPSACYFNGAGRRKGAAYAARWRALRPPKMRKNRRKAANARDCP